MSSVGLPPGVDVSDEAIGLPPGLDLSDEAIDRNWAQRCDGLGRAACGAAMGAIPVDKLPDAGTILGYIRVVENEVDPFVVAAAYVIAASVAKTTCLKQILPHLRDAVVWKLMRYSGDSQDKFRDVVKLAFGNAWGLVLHSQLMMAAMRALRGQELAWWSSPYPPRAGRKPQADTVLYVI